MTFADAVNVLSPVLFCPSWVPLLRLVIAGALLVVVLVVVRVSVIPALL